MFAKTTPESSYALTYMRLEAIQYIPYMSHFLPLYF